MRHLGDRIKALVGNGTEGPPESCDTADGRSRGLRLSRSRPISRPVAGYPGSSALIGRANERTLVERVLQGGEKGRGGMLLVSGSIGSGKTRLLEHIADRAAARSYLIVQGHAAEGDRLPYAPFRRVLEGPVRGGREVSQGSSSAALPLAAAVVEGQEGLRLRDYGRSVGSRVGLSKEWGRGAMEELLAPSIGSEPTLEELPPAGAAARLLDRLEERAHGAPLLILLDSFQWADTASLALLRPLAHDARRRALVVVVAHDAGETAIDGASRTGPTMEETARIVQRESGAVQIRLQGLSDAEVKELAEGILQAPLVLEKGGRLPEMLARTQGNPFLVQEVVRAGLRDGWILRRGEGYRVLEPSEDLQVPTLLRWWVHRRIQSLLPDDRTLLEAISVLGSEFDPRALPMLLPEMAPRLRRSLERLEVRYRVVHPLRPSVWQVEPGFLASVVRSEMSGEVLRRLHRRAGEWHAAHDPNAQERIASHYVQAREPSLALPWLERAWKAASDRGDFEASMRNARDGAEMAETLSLPDSVLTWKLREASATYQAGEVERAVGLIESALATAPPGIARVDLLCELSLMETRRGNPEKAMAVLNRADSEPVPEKERPSCELRVRLHRFEVLTRFQRWEEACREAPSLLSELDRRGQDLEPRQLMRARISYGTALTARGEFERAKEVLMDTLTRARKAGMVTSVANARTSLGILAWTMGDLAAARAIFEQAAEEWRLRGALTNEAINTSNSAEVLLSMGDLEEAQRRLEEAIELYEVSGLSQVQAAVTPLLARCALERGDVKTAEMILKPLLPSGRLDTQAEVSREAHATMARILLAQGKVEAAWREAEQGGAEVTGIGGSYAARTYALAAAARGESGKGEAILVRLIEETRKEGRRLDLALALVDLGDLMALEGRTSEALARWTEALGGLRACGALGRAAVLEERRKKLQARL